MKRNRDDRQEFHNQAMVRMLKPIDSHTNFLMVNTQHPAEEVIEHFRKNNILIGRHFPPMDTFIRVFPRHARGNARLLADVGHDPLVKELYTPLRPGLLTGRGRRSNLVGQSAGAQETQLLQPKVRCSRASAGLSSDPLRLNSSLTFDIDHFASFQPVKLEKGRCEAVLVFISLQHLGRRRRAKNF